MTRTSTAALKVVLLTESDSLNQGLPSVYKYRGTKLWEKIRAIVTDLGYCCETVELNQLDFQEDESMNKFLNAAIVIMDVTNPDRRPTFMYHKGNRESVDCMDDIVLIQASGVENDNDIQDLKTTCEIKRFIVYRYDEEQDTFYDVSLTSSKAPVPLKKTLKSYLYKAANNMQQGLSTRYLNLMEKRKNKGNDENAQRNFLWREICDEILTETNQRCATPKLIAKLMYAFRDLQDYQSMIELSERCEQYPTISAKIQNHMLISYLTAFARSRRNQNGDRDKALEILQRLCQTNKAASKLSNDIVCLRGRIYKDKYTESNCEDKVSLEKAVKWYRRGFAADPNIYAGINLLLLLAITTDDLMGNNEAYKIILQLNALLGKKSRSLRDLRVYWDVATYFELHAVQHDWTKACQAALHMYLLNPPSWYLKSTINNLKILHRATRVRDQQRLREHPRSVSVEENIYSFWIDFFTDAINSYSTSDEEKELPAQMPILVCDNYEQTDGTTVNNVFSEALLQLNFHTDDGSETLVIRVLEHEKQIKTGALVKTIDMNSIRSILNVKRDSRSIFLFAYENSETFSSVEMQIYFSSAERRTAFNEKMSRYRVETVALEVKSEFDLQFERDPHGQRIALGQGRYGKVYEARDRITFRKFAVKEIAMLNPDYTQVLENEIKTLSTLNHKNIISYYGSAIDSRKKPYIFQIIMEYVDGGSLLKHIAKCKPFSEESIQNYTRQLLEGVQYLHENRILHRDIKSANILVSYKGEIKIADFGTSKRLAGLHLCTEETVGSLPYMCPNVVLVPAMGYGPEVDIWSVGCVVIEMATGKRPFHNIANEYQLLMKLGNEKQPPEIPPELSDIAKDFLSKCFELTETPPSARDLLNHPFLKTKMTLKRESSSSNHLGDKIESVIRLTDSSSSLQRESSEDDSIFFEPARNLAAQVSIDDRRRLELASMFRDEESREALIGYWISLIGEKRETDLLDIQKLLTLLGGICDYLEGGNPDSLEHALDKICDRTSMDDDLRIDLERRFYFFIKAANTVLLSNNDRPPHVLFALDNIVRRVAEHLVGLIRSDFVPANNNMIPCTPNGDYPSSSPHPRMLSASSVDETINDEVTRLYQQYRKLSEKNREQLHQLIKIESDNEIDLTALRGRQRSNDSKFLNTITQPPAECLSSSQSADVFLPVEPSLSREEVNSLLSPITEGVNGSHVTPMKALSKGIKRSRALFELEQEHEGLLKNITDNRTRLNELLRSPNIL